MISWWVDYTNVCMRVCTCVKFCYVVVVSDRREVCSSKMHGGTVAVGKERTIGRHSSRGQFTEELRIATTTPTAK